MNVDVRTLILDAVVTDGTGAPPRPERSILVEDHLIEEEVARQADEGCTAEFTEFVGLDYQESVLEVLYYYPSAISWVFDRTVVCVITDPAGEVAAMALIQTNGECCYIARLATRRDQRGRGLAQALLVDSFRAGAEHGSPRAELSTDSRTGALGLYEKVGMRTTSVWVNRAIAVGAA